MVVRMHEPDLSELDALIAEQPDPKPSRPEAIRQIVKFALDMRRKDRGGSLHGGDNSEAIALSGRKGRKPTPKGG